MSGEAARDVMRVCEELRVVCTDLQRHVTKRIYPLAVEMEQPLPKPVPRPGRWSCWQLAVARLTVSFPEISVLPQA